MLKPEEIFSSLDDYLAVCNGAVASLQAGLDDGLSLEAAMIRVVKDVVDAGELSEQAQIRSLLGVMTAYMIHTGVHKTICAWDGYDMALATQHNPEQN